MLKPYNLRETIREALSALPKKRRGQSTDQDRKFMRREKEKHEKRLQEEQVELRKNQEKEKQINEERRVIEKIGQNGSDRFLSNLNLYNKYYAEYLNEPETQFVNQRDLRVEIKPRIEESALSRKRSTLFARKGTISAVKFPPAAVPKKQSCDTEDRATTPNRKPGMVKFMEHVKDKADLDTDTDSAGNREERIVVSEEIKQKNNWSLFKKDMTKVETNLNGLQRIGVMINANGELNKEEFNFMRAVKNGNQEETSTMLKNNSRLVKVKDLVIFLT